MSKGSICLKIKILGALSVVNVRRVRLPPSGLPKIIILNPIENPHKGFHQVLLDQDFFRIHILSSNPVFVFPRYLPNAFIRVVNFGLAQVVNLGLTFRGPS